MNRNEELYDRQRGLGLAVPKSACVVGAGGVGVWVALLLAMSGVEELRLFDSDHVELSNLARLPYSKLAVGELKTDILRLHIADLRPDAHVETYPNAEEYILNATKSDILFDCTDRQKVQLMLQTWCKDAGVHYIRAGYDGTHMTVTDNVPEWTTEDDLGGYAHQPSWVVPTAIIAGLAVSKALYAPSQEINCDLAELGGKHE